VMFVWQSAQILFPTNVAPSISGGEIKVRFRVEQELSAKPINPSAPNANSPLDRHRIIMSEIVGNN
jgi:hypothetical protein